MKKHLLFFALLLFLTTQTKAQTSVYHPFPDSNAVWQVEYGGYESTRCELYQNTFDNDTIVNAISYHKIHKKGVRYSFNGQTGYCTNSVIGFIDKYFCALRYDSAQKKVFMLPENLTIEYLIYDFSLSEGDTVHSYLLGYGGYNDRFDTVVVSSIDSVLVGNDYRKRWNLKGDNNYSSIIEGVGAMSGVVETMGWFEEGGGLICFNQNGIPLYPDTTTICVLPNGINEVNKKPEMLNLQPNPTADKLLISGNWQSESGKRIVTIFNVLGQNTSPPAPLLEERGGAAIDVSGLPSGIYFVLIASR